ncbi:LexA family protein [Lacticaseibacillus kribbianus]|uniref:LexA family protein n=1 Tax=Lacticaseibacillus kribbianus TaxID=2926292 RepID=UPI001CD1BC93|nr:hypothetical protein [Lacticaseibacillus kribbianus]
MPRMMTPKEWRERELDLLTVIEQSLDERGYVPTVREICAGVGLSVGTVHNNMARMQRAKLIDWDRWKQRTLQVTELGDKLYQESMEERQREHDNEKQHYRR